MRYRIKTETLNNGTVKYIAQVCYTPPRKGRIFWWSEDEVWCNITSYGCAHNEQYCDLIMSHIVQHSEHDALQCIEAFKNRLKENLGNEVAKTEYKYL